MNRRKIADKLDAHINKPSDQRQAKNSHANFRAASCSAGDLRIKYRCPCGHSHPSRSMLMCRARKVIPQHYSHMNPKWMLSTPVEVPRLPSPSRKVVILSSAKDLSASS